MSKPLKGVQVYVDVRSSDGKANYSACVKEQLQKLGASIHLTLSNKCSHVVFKDGKINTRLHANKLGLTIVNVLWVERCRGANLKCDESQFPVTEEQVATPIHLRKAKSRYRSLQPSAIEKKVDKKRCGKPKDSQQQLKKENVNDIGENGAPLVNIKDKVKRKLKWPPDHSDVCSEAELAAHDEISYDIQKSNGKRKLKKSAVFDKSMENSRSTKISNKTDLFVIKKTYSSSMASTEDDSQLSLYDASQHFERTNYSITNLINNLNTKIEDQSESFEGLDDLYSDSEDEYNLGSPTKKRLRCNLTHSQKNVMDKTFEFDEMDKDSDLGKPKRRKKQVNKEKIKATIGNVDDFPLTNSPTKMLTFNSNFNDNSDIVTELDADDAKKDEISALKQIKSPSVVRGRSKRSKKPTSKATETASCNTNKEDINKVNSTIDQSIVNIKPVPRLRKSKSSYNPESITDSCIAPLDEIMQNNPIIVSDSSINDIADVRNGNIKKKDKPSGVVRNGKKDRKIKDKPEASDLVTSRNEHSIPISTDLVEVKSIDNGKLINVKNRKSSQLCNKSQSGSKANIINVLKVLEDDKDTLQGESPDPKQPSDLSTVLEVSGGHKLSENDSICTPQVLQEPMITSTSDARENSNQNKPRRISKRLRHNSSKLTNPDFFYGASPAKNTLPVAEVAVDCKKNDRKNTKYEHEKLSSSDTQSVVNETTKKVHTSCRKSERIRRSNPRYFPEDVSMKALPDNLIDSNDNILLTKNSKLTFFDTPTIQELNEGVNDHIVSPELSPGIKPLVLSNEGPAANIEENCTVNVSKEALKIVSPIKRFIQSSDHELLDLSTSEYSTTETPLDEKPMRKRELKQIATSTTDTEDSANELSKKDKPSSKRKLTRKYLDKSSDRIQNRSFSEASPKRTVCTTCCHRDDQAMVRTTAKQFSGTIAEFVDKTTTHVVVGNPKRTINLMKGIIHGAHVISLNWVTDSISKGCWQKEKKYVMISEFPVLKMKGSARVSLASTLFTDTGLMFVEMGTSPPRADLVSLIELCGGKVTRSRTRSRYCIGGEACDKEHVSLSEQWILDSITQLRLQDSNKYLRFPYRSPSPEF